MKCIRIIVSIFLHFCFLSVFSQTVTYHNYVDMHDYFPTGTSETAKLIFIDCGETISELKFNPSDGQWCSDQYCDGRDNIHTQGQGSKFEITKEEVLSYENPNQPNYGYQSLTNNRPKCGDFNDLAVRINWNSDFAGTVKFILKAEKRYQDGLDCKGGRYDDPARIIYVKREPSSLSTLLSLIDFSTNKTNYIVGENISVSNILTGVNSIYTASYTKNGNTTNLSQSDSKKVNVKYFIDKPNPTLSDQELRTNTGDISSSSLSIGDHTIYALFYNSCGTIGVKTKTITILPSCAGKTASLSILDNSGNAVTQEANFGIKLDIGTTYRLKVDGLPSLDDYTFSDNGGGDVTWGSSVTAVSGSSNSYYKTFSITPSPNPPAIAGLYNLNLTINQTSSAYSTCPQSATKPVGVGGANQTITKNCLITIPDDLSPKTGAGNEFVKNYDNTKDVPGLELSTFVYTVESSVGIIIKDGVTLSDGSVLKVNYTAPPTTSATELADLTKPWTQQTVYDEEGNIVADTRTYMDASMNVVQVQTKNIAANVVLASSILYDQYNRPAIQTLPAPVRSVGAATTDACGNVLPDYFGLYFGRKDDFVSTGTTAANYGVNNFENTSTTVQKRFSPDPLNNLGDGTLGRYYGNGYAASDAKAEPYAPKTSYPYVRTYSEDVGSTTKSYTTLPGNYHHLGTSHYMTSEVGPTDITSTSTTVIKDNDVLDKYLLVYAAAGFTVPTQAQFSAQLIRSIVTDTEGKKQITYTDNAGNTIITRHYDTDETWAFNIYDLQGRLRYEISPKGVSNFTSNASAGTTNFNDIDKTTYTYNFRGDLVSKSSTDGGTTNYMYRTDGQVRFSQSAVQAASSPKRFSYTLYDDIARPVESGEITLINPTSGTNDFATFGYSNTNFTSILNNTMDQNMPTTLQASTTEWIKIWYDGDGGPTPPSGFGTDFLVGRVSCTQRKNGYTTWYSYDDLGRTKAVAMDIPGLGTKSITYTYNKYGQVAEVVYQGGQSDGFTHSYDYDRSARLVAVATQRTGGPKVQEATYSYYLHGPLKEEKIAKGAVNEQTRFYTYTPQGWLKAINYKGDPAAAGNGQLFHEKLDYFEGDYGHDVTTYASLYTPENLSSSKYNGIPTGISYYNDAHASDQHFAYTYTYDTKNQLLESSFGTVDFTGTDNRPKITFPTAADKYKEKITGYDKNGNITGLQRYNGATTPVTVHNFSTYAYTANTNQLASITDDASTPNTLRTYSYDASGRTTAETQGTTTLTTMYNVSGMVTTVTKDSKAQLTNEYSDGGNKFKQIVYDTDGKAIKETYYVHDPNGNVLAVYEKDLTVASTVQLSELPIVGLGRIGNVYITYATVTDPNDATKTIQQTLNSYYYELNDHLGNVRVVFDRTSATGGKPTIHYFSDYYSFGLPISSRSSLGYRYSYQGQFAEDEKTTTRLYSFFWRSYDSEIGRWKVSDPLSQYYSPYMAMGNSPHLYLDPNGAWSFGGGPVIGKGVAAGTYRVFANGAWTTVVGAGASTPILRGLTIGLGALGSLGTLISAGVLAAVSQIAVSDTRTGAKEPEKYITLYRGVHKGHPAYNYASKGMAVPAGGDASQESHTGGNYKSNITSWSMSKSVADYHANKNGPGGLVLKKRFKLSEVIPDTDDFYAELQFFVHGIVTGADVQKPSGPGSPNAY